MSHQSEDGSAEMVNGESRPIRLPMKLSGTWKSIKHLVTAKLVCDENSQEGIQDNNIVLVTHTCPSERGSF